MTDALLVTLWLVPLAGALFLWVFGRQMGRASGTIGSIVVFVSFALAVMLFGPATSGGVTARLGSWGPGLDLGLSLDPLSLIWTLVIAGVGGLIHIYSIGYMWRDGGIARFFTYLNFFIFAMLTLVLADNLIGLLVGWGLVGLASYFLIGFWFDRPAAVAASRKAFVINVFGDIGLMFAIFVIYATTHAVTYAALFARASTIPAGVVFAICVGLFIGAMAKSAQVPLHTWLPDAMEGPTPVSALIHAATMVTAGVYLVARFEPIWRESPAASELVAIVGAITMVTGAILGIAQWDIKRILAYSTMSQIGYMVMAVGVGAYEAGILHFFTHAFFKAQLFLGAGLIIHALDNEQDVRKMGGLYRRLPFAFWAMLLGTLAIIGFPLFSGSYSKDAIIYGALAHGHPILFGLGAATAGVTAYYMFRLLFLTFFGPERGGVANGELGISEHAHAAHHEAADGHDAPPWIMTAPVGVLMIPTVIAGYLAIGGDASPWSRYFASLFGATSPESAALPEIAVTFIVLALVTLGIVVAYLRYGSPRVQPDAVARLRRESLGMPLALRRAFFFDDIIAALIVRPARALGTFFARVIDPRVLDAGVTDLAWGAGALGALVRAAQNGLVRAYALWIVLGAAAFLGYFALLGATR